jgi:hypothetical protein
MLLSEGFVGTSFAPLTQQHLPWPEYRPAPRQEVLYPARLRAGGSIPFDLYTPGATIVPLVGLLNAYGKVIQGIPQMITLLFLWMKVCNRFFTNSPADLSESPIIYTKSPQLVQPFS